MHFRLNALLLFNVVVPIPCAHFLWLISRHVCPALTHRQTHTWTRLYVNARFQAATIFAYGSFTQPGGVTVGSYRPFVRPSTGLRSPVLRSGFHSFAHLFVQISSRLPCRHMRVLSAVSASFWLTASSPRFYLFFFFTPKPREPREPP